MVMFQTLLLTFPTLGCSGCLTELTHLTKTSPCGMWKMWLSLPICSRRRGHSTKTFPVGILVLYGTPLLICLQMQYHSTKTFRAGARPALAVNPITLTWMPAFKVKLPYSPNGDYAHSLVLATLQLRTSKLHLISACTLNFTMDWTEISQVLAAQLRHQTKPPYNLQNSEHTLFRWAQSKHSGLEEI